VRAVLLGVGAVGARAARQLASSAEVDRVVLCDRVATRAEAVAASLGPVAQVAAWSPALLGEATVLVVAGPDPVVAAKDAIDRAVPVVAVADGVADVEALLGLDTSARQRGVTVAIGAGMAPGLTCVLAGYAAARFDRVEEIHVAKAGTGGPACARQHHRALAAEAIDWRDGAWLRRGGGSGRELCWFPDPVCGLDCYRAALPDALLLVPAFPGVTRVTARMAASRRDRLTSALPMLRPPHPEGEVGAVRVEVRGERGGQRDVEVLGVIDRPAVAAGAVAAVTAVQAASGGLARTGAAGLAEMVGDPATFLAELNRRGVKAALFEGARA
jgi:saccharopine dehydrogenase-like NADP-dependent oxidoreductase